MACLVVAVWANTLSYTQPQSPHMHCLSPSPCICCSPSPFLVWHAGVVVAVWTNTLSYNQAFSAFGNDTIWLILGAFFFAKVRGGFSLWQVPVRHWMSHDACPAYMRPVGTKTPGARYASCTRNSGTPAVQHNTPPKKT